MDFTKWHITTLEFERCILSKGVIERLAEIKNIEKICFDFCKYDEGELDKLLTRRKSVKVIPRRPSKESLFE
jgi:hypothetical protein